MVKKNYSRVFSEKSKKIICNSSAALTIFSDSCQLVNKKIIKLMG